MDTLRNVLLLVLVIFQAFRIHSQCLPGCSCISDRQGRSLTCMENAFQGIPVNVPEDMTKIRIEKSSFREIPSGAFLQLASLESLWLNFNDITVLDVKCLAGLGNLTELRLQGNKLRSVPWTAFEDTPALNILDLKHNRLDVLPEYALKYLPGLTYLDVSFNQLTIVSKDVFLNWPLYQRIQNSEEREKGFIPNVVLALHDNAWLCDCRLKGFVEFVRSLSPPIILMNSYLSCAGPDFKAGKFFHDVALQVCMKPVASTGAANLTMPLAESVTFRCVAKGRPVPAVWWTYGLKIIRGFHESQERVDEDTISTQLVIPSVQLADRGVYTCTANNFLGNSSVGIQLDVLTQDGVRSAAPPGGSVPAIASEEYVYIDLRITKQTVYGITIEWHAAIDRTTETWFTVHFGMAGAGKKELIYIGPGINSYTVADLMPATKYEICVTIKNQAPRPGQCVVFVTGNDISELEQRQKLIHIIVIVLGMVLAVPAGMFACTTDVRLNCVERFLEFWRSRRRGAEELERAGSGDRQWAGQGDRQCTFDSLQAASDEGLVRDSTDDNKKLRRRSEDKTVKGKDQSRITELLY